MDSRLNSTLSEGKLLNRVEGHLEDELTIGYEHQEFSTTACRPAVSVHMRPGSEFNN